MRATLPILATAVIFTVLPLAGGCGDDGGSGTGGSGTGGSGTGATGSGASGTGGGATCGGIGGEICGADEWCDYPDDQCGATDGQGTCKPRPNACTDEEAPRCGCDGTVHSNACDAETAGVDVSTLGTCTPPAGTFACGAQFCATNDVCSISGNDVPPPVAYYSCNPPPAACTATTTCACAGDLATGCGGTCEDVAGGGVTITCPGG